MMRKIIRVLSLIVTLLLTQVAAFAWGETAHMVIAQIAYTRLNPAARARVDRLVKLLKFGTKTYNYITVATMLDDFRSDETKDSFKPWHFTSDPIFDGIAPFYIDLPQINVEERINFLVEKLKGSGTGSDLKDAQYVAYLIHLVGDIHQPLHTATRYSPTTPKGDSGGNLFIIQGPRRNLHSYWDAAAGLFGFTDVARPLTAAGRTRIIGYALEATRAYPPSSPEWRDMDVSNWVKEGHDLAISTVYNGIQEHTKLSDEYQARAQDVCRKRLATAGYRLAQLLNEIYAAR